AGLGDLDVHATAVALVAHAHDQARVGEPVDGVRHRRGADPLALGEFADGQSSVHAQTGEDGEVRVADVVAGALAAQASSEAEGGEAQVGSGVVQKIVRLSHYLGSLTKFL